MPQEIHPLVAREILTKEPEEESTFNFDFTDSERIDPDTNISSVAGSPAPSVSPDEEHRRISIGAITGGPFLSGEKITASGGAEAHVKDETADGAATIDFYIARADTIGSGEVLTGERSGATATTSGSATKIADGLILDSFSASGKVVQVNLTKGLRPLQGRPWREYLLMLYATSSDNQKIPCLGRVRIAEAAKADNP